MLLPIFVCVSWVFKTLHHQTGQHDLDQLLLLLVFLVRNNCVVLGLALSLVDSRFGRVDRIIVGGLRAHPVVLIGEQRVRPPNTTTWYNVPARLPFVYTTTTGVGRVNPERNARIFVRFPGHCVVAVGGSQHATTPAKSCRLCNLKLQPAQDIRCNDTFLHKLMLECGGMGQLCKQISPLCLLQSCVFRSPTAYLYLHHVYRCAVRLVRFALLL